MRNIHISLYILIISITALFLVDEVRAGDVKPVSAIKASTPAKLKANIKSSAAATPDSRNIVRTLSLDDCIEVAIENHLPLRVAEKNIRLAKMRLLEARRNMLPTFSARWEESYGKVYGRRYYGKKTYIEGQQTLFHGGELYYTMKQAEVNHEVVKNDYNRIKNDLILQVKKAYYTLAKAKENLNIQHELSNDVAKISEMVSQQYEAGVMAKIELMNVESQASQVKFQLTSAAGDLSVADLILKQSMYIAPVEKIDIAPRLEFKKLNVRYEDVLSVALVSRPEMKINSYMVNYYNYERKIANAKGWWPKIDILGSWGLAKEEYIAKDMGPDPATGNTDPDQKLEQQWYAGFKVAMPIWGSTAEYSYTREQWTAVVSAYRGTEASTQALKLNLLDNMKSFSEMQTASIDFDRARQELAKTENDVTLDVRESCFNYDKALAQFETAKKKMEYQEKDLEVVRVKREMDEAQDSNVIDSMIKLAQEKFGYVQALTDYYIAVASINKAAGVEDYFQLKED
jgi:outer membrane protein